MIRRAAVGYGAMFAFTTLSWVAPALAQAPQASPVAQEKASAQKGGEPGAKPDKGEKDKGEKGAPKGEERPRGPEGNQAKIDNKAEHDPAGAGEKRDPDDAKLKDRLQRRRHQQDSEHAKIAAALRGQPMSEAMHQEFRRHARRLARLERIKAIATEAKDTAIIERVNKLIEKENARHDKFTTRVDEKDDKAKGDDKAKDDKAKDDKGKDDKGKDDKVKNDKGKDDKVKDDKGGAK
jgi:hypothetical protein